MKRYQMIESKRREIVNLDERGKPTSLVREFSDNRPLRRSKRDHLKEMRQGFAIFAAGVTIMALFVVFVLRPWEKDLVREARDMVKEQVEVNHDLVDRYNHLADRYRELWRSR